MNLRNALIWRKNPTDHEYILTSVLCASPNKTMRSKMSFIAFQQWRIWYLHKYHSHIIKDDTILKWCNNFLVSLRRCCGVVADVLTASSQQHNHPVTRHGWPNSECSDTLAYCTGNNFIVERLWLMNLVNWFHSHTFSRSNPFMFMDWHSQMLHI